METVGRALELLARERDFRRLIGAQCVAQMADGIAQAAIISVLVLDPLAQDTPDKILGLFALTLLPYSVVSPFLGVFVDRWSRRRLLAGTNLARGAVLITLPVWSLALPANAELYVGIFLMLGLGRLFLTTKGASIPAVLHEHELLKGNAISSGAGMISALAGGIVGLIGRGVFEANAVVVVAGSAYAASGLIATMIRAPLAHPHHPERSVIRALVVVGVELSRGVRAVWNEVRARLPLFGIFILRSIAMFIAIAAILIIKKQFPGEVGEGGRLSWAALALGAAGAGAFLGALSAAALGRRFDKPRLILVGFVISGAGIAALGGVENIVAILLLMLVGGYGSFVTKVATDAQIQEALPDDFRGRAFALYDILYNLASVVAGAVMVVFAGSSLRLVLSLTGLATLAIAGLLAILMTRARMLAAAGA